jgi:heat shock protein HslJ
MTNKSKLTILLLLFSLVFSGCSVFMDKMTEMLNDTTWRLVSYNSQFLIPGSEMTMEFSQREISGSASCNHYFGSYKVNGDQISISGLGWTEMACLDPAGIMKQEQTLMALLSKAVQFTLQGNTLQIITSSGEILVFERIFP